MGQPLTAEELAGLGIYFRVRQTGSDEYEDCSREDLGMPQSEYDLVQSSIRASLGQPLTSDKAKAQLKSFSRLTGDHKKCYREYVIGRQNPRWSAGLNMKATCETCVTKASPCFTFDKGNCRIIVLGQVSQTDLTTAAAWLPAVASAS